MIEIEPEVETAAAPAKKRGLLKLLMIVGGLVVLLGGGIAGGLYAAQAGLFGGKGASKAEEGPQLVPKSAEQRATLEGASGGEGEGGSEAHAGTKTPEGSGGEKYASNYYQLDKEFTSNLQDSIHFVQVGIAVSTPYDNRVLENLKTHEIAVRSAILMALSETDEEQVFTTEGKRQLQARLVKAINATLKQKEGFGGIGNVYFTNFIVQ